MDVYFAPEAYKHFQALGLIVTSQNADGLIIGHKRGQSFFVEHVLSTTRGFFPSLEKYFSLNILFKNKLIGFYSFRSDEKKIKKILAPFACGKLYLDIQVNPSKPLVIKPSFVDYGEDFFLSPLRLKPPQIKE